MLTCLQTSPQKKLPAFYVLDSVVKNVGTPYTIFLSRGLYSTFMEAYALVDTNVRRKMDEMLKTWKEPVPGALDTRPVFPRDVTGPIENALIKARTSAVQAHNEYLRSQQQNRPRSAVPNIPPHRDTPTPPATYRQAPPPTTQNPPNTYQGSQNSYRQPSQQAMPTPPTSFRPPPPAISTPPVNYALAAHQPNSYGGTPQPPAPTHYGMPVQPHPSNSSNPAPPQLPPSMLMELLRASGRLPQMPVPPAPPVNVPTPPLNSTQGFPPPFGAVPPPYVKPPPVVNTPPFVGATPVPRVPLSALPNDVVFSDPHSLKLYDSFP
jgi:hypothetical protein